MQAFGLLSTAKVASWIHLRYWSLLLAALGLMVSCIFNLESGLADDDYHSTRELSTGLELFVPQWSSASDRILLDEVSVEYPSADELGFLSGVAFRPRLAPNGQRAVYSVDPEGNRIWRIGDRYSIAIEISKLNGTDKHRLTENDGLLYLSPSWSPDGSLIAFARHNGIYTISSDGSSEQFLVEFTDPFQLYQAGPVWSPDGTTLAFVIQEGPVVETADGLGRGVRHVLFTVEATGSNLIRVFSTTIQYGYRSPDMIGWPAWSPNGQKLAFVRYVYPQLKETLEAVNAPVGFTPYVIRKDGSDLQQVASGIPSGPWKYNLPFPNAAWSPDGTKIIYGLGTGRLYLAHADGSQHWEVGDGNFASWSPDGSRIAVTADYGRTSAATLPYDHLWTMAPDGSDRRVLVRRDEGGELAAANTSLRTVRRGT